MTPKEKAIERCRKAGLYYNEDDADFIIDIALEESEEVCNDCPRLKEQAKEKDKIIDGCLRRNALLIKEIKKLKS